MKRKRPVGLLIIVDYKVLFAVLLAITSTALWFAPDNTSALINFSESYLFEGKLAVVETLIIKLLKQTPQSLHYTSLFMGLYAAVTAIEAGGLWLQKLWAETMTMILVGLGVVPETYELSKGFTLLQFSVLMINLAIFAYLVTFFRRQVRFSSGEASPTHRTHCPK